MSILEWTLFGNMVQTWLLALLLAIGAVAIFWLLERILIRRFTAFARNTTTGVDDVLAQVSLKTRLSLLTILALYLGTRVLALPPAVDRWAGTIAWITLLIQIAIWGNALVSIWLLRYQRRNLEHDAARVTTFRAVGFVARLVLFSVLLLLALDNVPGVEVTTLIASLGVGGVAVALAVQNILADLFASLSIALDKPFVIGDFIVVGEYMGTVENVGLKTTRVRSLSGEQLVFANNDLLNSRIRNYKRMGERRVLFSLGVTYDTTHEKLAQIPAVIQEIVEAQEQTRFDRAHFHKFGDFALNFEVVYYVLDPDYNMYMDIQQAINLAIIERFEAMGVSFAYPTQTLHFANGQGVGNGLRAPATDVF